MDVHGPPAPQFEGSPKPIEVPADHGGPAARGAEGDRAYPFIEQVSARGIDASVSNGSPGIGAGEPALGADAGAETAVASVERQPLPAPDLRGLVVPDASTMVAGVVVVGGLLVAAWLRGGGARSAFGGALRGALRGAVRGARTKARAAEVGNADAARDSAEQLALLIREADERISELRALRAEIESRATPRGVSACPSGVGRLTGERAGRGGDEAEPSRSVLGSDPLAGRIVELAQAGRTAVEIAGELGEHTGKVELILALSRVGPRPGSAAGTGALGTPHDHFA